MNAISIILLFSYLSCVYYPQNVQFTEPITKKIVLDNEKSSIQIIGTTNVNEFECNYVANILSDTLSVCFNTAEEKTFLAEASFSLPIKKFECESNQMTEDFQTLLKADHHPYITIQLLSFYQKVGVNYVELSIGLAGVKNNYVVQTEIHKSNNMFYCQGKPELCIQDFGLKPPEKFFGMVKVNELISVEFNIAFIVIDP